MPAHDWGVTAPDDLPTEIVRELRDGLRSGRIKLDLSDAVPRSPEIERWLRECTAQMIACYDDILRRRMS